MRIRIGLLGAIGLPLLAGCATIGAAMDELDEGPNGISHSQQRVRDALVRGDFPSALASDESDELLRTLTVGTAAFYAAQYQRSAVVLDTAARMADDRITTSLSRGALSLVSNETAQAYSARRTERLLIPYYGMLDFVKLARWGEAAVEARRLVGLLAQYEPDRDESERRLHASMQFLAGVIFERADEGQDAAVAYRIAHALEPRYPEHPAPTNGREGQAIVVLERGFVAHRITEMVRLEVAGRDRRQRLPHEDEGVDTVRRGRVGRQSGIVDSGIYVAPPLRRGAREDRTAAVFSSASRVGPGGAVVSRRHRSDDQDAAGNDDEDRAFSIALPALRRSPHASGDPPRLVTDGTITVDVDVVANLDDASLADERRERVAIVARALARAATKATITRAIRDRNGEVAGGIADVGSHLLERADVRSWHLLPQEIVILRARIPAGTRTLRLEPGMGGSAMAVDLGSVVIPVGGVVILPARWWGTPGSEGTPPGAHW